MKLLQVPLLLCSSSVKFGTAKYSVTVKNSKSPYTRMPVLHSSGILELLEERVDAELEANMAGRVEQTCEGQKRGRNHKAKSDNNFEGGNEFSPDELTCPYSIRAPSMYHHTLLQMY